MKLDMNTAKNQFLLNRTRSRKILKSILYMTYSPHVHEKKATGASYYERGLLSAVTRDLSSCIDIRARNYRLREQNWGMDSRLLHETSLIDVARDVDIVHQTSAIISGGLDELSQSDLIPKLVVTILDVIAAARPKLMPEGTSEAVRFVVKGFAKHRIPVLTISESTRQDIIDLGVDPDLIEVTHISCDESFSPQPKEKTDEVLRKYGLEKPYYLNVASFEKRKNHTKLILAYSRLPEAVRKEFDLVLIGQDVGWKDENLPDMLKTPGVRWLDYAPSYDLPALYTGASCFVWPSLYEGFGIPLLEAMRCRVPVITSNVSSMPEVVGDAGILIDPSDEESIASAMFSVVQDEEIKRRCIERGVLQASKFSWDICVRKTLEFYKRQFGFEIPETFLISTDIKICRTSSTNEARNQVITEKRLSIKQKHFIVVDSICKDFQGHFHEYSMSVLEAAMEKGYKPVLLANADFPVTMAPDFLTIRNVFTQDCLIQHREPVGVANSYEFYREIKNGLNGIGPLGSDDIIFMHTLNFIQVDGWRYWIEDTLDDEMPNLVFVFRDNIDSQHGLDTKIDHLNKSDRRGRICFVSDSALLAEQYSKKTGVPVSVVPIPVRTRIDISSKVDKVENHKRLRMVYLGDCRSEKGYPLLVKALEDNLDLIRNGIIEVVVQSNFNVYDPHDFINAKAARDTLAGLASNSNGGLLLIYKSLTGAQYKELLNSADIVLLPYMPEAYGGRTSGIFAEALAAGKVIIASSWPWIEQQMKNYPCGIIMSDYSPKALSKAIRFAIASYPQLCPAHNVVNQWCDYHSPRNLVGSILNALTEKSNRESLPMQNPPIKSGLVYDKILEEMVQEIEQLRSCMDPTAVATPRSDHEPKRWIFVAQECIQILRTRYPRIYSFARRFFYDFASLFMKIDRYYQIWKNRISTRHS